MRVTFTITVQRHPNYRCSPAGEDWACSCSDEEVEREVTAEVDGEDVRLLSLKDEDGRQVSLGDLSKQEQIYAQEVAAEAAERTAA